MTDDIITVDLSDPVVLLNCYNKLNAFYRKLNAENERLRLALHDIYEVYAGSEGIPEPVTCSEAYLLSLLQQMVEIAAEHKK